MSQNTIWVDADACPNPIKEMVFRAAERKSIMAIFVANQLIKVPASAFIRAVRVASGFDVADNYIVEELQAGDLVITADIPLAADAIAKGALAINPRGELYTAENIRQRLTMRDFMEELRGAGIQTQGPNSFTAADKHAFAKSLDAWLVKR